MDPAPRGTACHVRVCEECGVSFGHGAALPPNVKRVRKQGGAAWSARRFCSRECKGAAETAGKVVRRPKADPSTWATSWAWERAKRDMPIEGRLCECCGDPAKIRHHRDEDKRNNAPENIALLCQGCHVWIHKKREPGSLEEAKRRHEKELLRIAWLARERAS